MQPVILFRLRARRAQILSSWAALLTVEPVTSALANPQVLRHHFDDTLDRVFSLLHAQVLVDAPAKFRCPCGQNPFLAYFRAGEQALVESLVMVHAEAGETTPASRWQDVVDLQNALRSVGLQEISAFGGVCVHRDQRCGACPAGGTAEAVKSSAVAGMC